MSITIKQYTSESRDIWNGFNKNSKNGIFMFDRNFMEYHSDRFMDNSLLFFNDGKLIALLPASLHGKELRSHGGLTYGGFIVNSEMKQHYMLDCFSYMKEYMKENNISNFIYTSIPHIYHKQPAEEDLYALYASNAGIYKIEPSTTIFLSNPGKIQKGRKAQANRAKREGVVIEPSDDFDTFIKLENTVLSERHGTKAVHNATELNLLNLRFPENIKLFGSFYKGEMIAAALLFIYETVVHTQYLAANEKAREIGGLDLLIRTIIEKYSSSKEYFDFGISTEDNGQYLNKGLIAQKEGFGGRTVCYVTWRLSID